MSSVVCDLIERENNCNVKLVLLQQNAAMIPLRCDPVPRINEEIMVGNSRFKVHSVTHVNAVSYLSVNMMKD